MNNNNDVNIVFSEEGDPLIVLEDDMFDFNMTGTRVFIFPLEDYFRGFFDNDDKEKL